MRAQVNHYPIDAVAVHVWVAFNNAMQDEVEDVTMFTDHNGDVWSVTQGAGNPYRVAIVNGWECASW